MSNDDRKVVLCLSLGARLAIQKLPAPGKEIAAMWLEEFTGLLNSLIDRIEKLEGKNP